MRYKAWRSAKDMHLLVICGAGEAAADALPWPVRSMGPWSGGKEGEVVRLRPVYRTLVEEQGFAVVYRREGQSEVLEG